MFRTSRKLPARILLPILYLLSLEAGAAQILSGKPDDTLTASISRSEPSLLRIEGQRIRRVLGAEDDFTVIPDKDNGTAYLKPGPDKSAFSVFVADSSGRTWKLFLAVTEGPAESIVIQPRTSSAETARGRELPRQQAIKRLLRALDQAEGNDTASQTVNEIIPLWNEALFVRVKFIDGPLRGEKYRLTNTSERSMFIDERELYRRGVIAIATERPELAPAESTNVFIITESGE